MCRLALLSAHPSNSDRIIFSWDFLYPIYSSNTANLNLHFYNAFFAFFRQVLIYKKTMGSQNNTIINVTEQKKIGDIFNPSDSFQTNKKNTEHHACVCLDVKVAIYLKKNPHFCTHWVE